MFIYANECMYVYVHQIYIYVCVYKYKWMCIYMSYYISQRYIHTYKTYYDTTLCSLGFPQEESEMMFSQLLWLLFS